MCQTWKTPCVDLTQARSKCSILLKSEAAGALRWDSFLGHINRGVVLCKKVVQTSKRRTEGNGADEFSLLADQDQPWFPESQLEFALVPTLQKLHVFGGPFLILLPTVNLFLASNMCSSSLFYSSEVSLLQSKHLRQLPCQNTLQVRR